MQEMSGAVGSPGTHVSQQFCARSHKNARRAPMAACAGEMTRGSTPLYQCFRRRPATNLKLDVGLPLAQLDHGGCIATPKEALLGE